MTVAAPWSSGRTATPKSVGFESHHRMLDECCIITSIVARSNDLQCGNCNTIISRLPAAGYRVMPDIWSKFWPHIEAALW